MLLRRVARPMLAGIFIYGGVNALRSPETHARAARPVVDAVGPAIRDATALDAGPDAQTLVRIDASVKIVAGSLLALNKAPRLAATALAASLVPTTLAAHRFWEEEDPAQRSQQRVQFLKNVSLLGGLLIASADTAGRPSLGWRGRRAARRAAKALSGPSTSLADKVAHAADRAGGLAVDAAGRAGVVAGDVAGRAGGLAVDVAGRAGGVAAERAGDVASAVAARGGGVAERVSGVAAGLVGLAPGAAVSARASELAEELAARAAQARRKAEQRGARLQETAEKRRAALQKAAAKRGTRLQKRAAKRSARLQRATSRRWAELEKQLPVLWEQAAEFGHDVADRAASVGAEVEGVAKDARKRVAALAG